MICGLDCFGDDSAMLEGSAGRYFEVQYDQKYRPDTLFRSRAFIQVQRQICNGSTQDEKQTHNISRPNVRCRDQAAASSHDCCKHHRPKNPHFPPSICRLLVSGNILSWKDRLTYISGHSLSGSDERWARVGVSGMRLEETRSRRCRIWTIERGKTLDLDVARVLSWGVGEW